MIAITEPNPIDITLARRLHRRSDIKYDFPNRFNLFSELIAYDEKGMIAYGGIDLVPEGFLVVDQSASTYRRAKAIKQLIEAGEFRLREFRFDQLLTFTSDPETAQFLRQLGFNTIKEGMLTKEVR